jgi:uncharacterized Zn finger protein (UPF0148 family)
MTVEFKDGSYSIEWGPEFELSYLDNIIYCPFCGVKLDSIILESAKQRHDEMKETKRIQHEIEMERIREEQEIRYKDFVKRYESENYEPKLFDFVYMIRYKAEHR